MQNAKELNSLVWMLCETDEFDGVALIGAACHQYEDVTLVLWQDDPNGWLDSGTAPYLVFYDGEPPTTDQVVELLEHAVVGDKALFGVPVHSAQPEHCLLTGTASVRTAGDGLAPVARAGTRLGQYFNHVTYHVLAEGHVRLHFTNDKAHDTPAAQSEETVGSDDFNLSY